MYLHICISAYRCIDVYVYMCTPFLLAQVDWTIVFFCDEGRMLLIFSMVISLGLGKFLSEWYIQYVMGNQYIHTVLNYFTIHLYIY